MVLTLQGRKKATTMFTLIFNGFIKLEFSGFDINEFHLFKKSSKLFLLDFYVLCYIFYN